MIRFLSDEDLPRSTAKVLRKAGFESIDVRDIGLRGAKDDVIYRRALRKRTVSSSPEI
jgi:predicted nuclease of predicted toxin-antitoxin system